MRIDFEDLKERIGVDTLLEHLGAELPRFGGGFGWRAMRCPFHDDSQASASVNYSEGRFRCHACDVGGDIIDLARAELALPETPEGTREAVDWLERELG